LDLYPAVKTLHILSATVLFGTGLGIAYFFWMGGRSGDDRVALFAARATVLADFLFTLSAVIVQPLTGAWLVWRGGFNPLDLWLVTTYALFAIAGACWVPVVFIQIRIRRLLEIKVAGRDVDSDEYARLRRWWFFLGWPAFVSLILVFHLMVTKPS